MIKNRIRELEKKILQVLKNNLDKWPKQSQVLNLIGEKKSQEFLAAVKSLQSKNQIQQAYYAGDEEPSFQITGEGINRASETIWEKIWNERVTFIALLSLMISILAYGSADAVNSKIILSSVPVDATLQIINQDYPHPPVPRSGVDQFKLTNGSIIEPNKAVSIIALVSNEGQKPTGFVRFEIGLAEVIKDGKKQEGWVFEPNTEIQLVGVGKEGNSSGYLDTQIYHQYCDPNNHSMCFGKPIEPGTYTINLPVGCQFCNPEYQNITTTLCVYDIDSNICKNS